MKKVIYECQYCHCNCENEIKTLHEKHCSRKNSEIFTMKIENA